jgi:hypothetical protein
MEAHCFQPRKIQAARPEVLLDCRSVWRFRGLPDLQRALAALGIVSTILLVRSTRAGCAFVSVGAFFCPKASLLQCSDDRGLRATRMAADQDLAAICFADR